jgi:hypothetical protein
MNGFHLEMMLINPSRCFELVAALFLLALSATAGSGEEARNLKEFQDDQYAFRFLYPADWQLDVMPEAGQNPGMRVRLRGPAGSSFVAIVENTGKSLSRMEFERDGKSQERVQAMMRQTLQETYRSISRNLGALSMKTGETLNLSDERAVKFYLATLHPMKSGSPVVVAGTHVYPFSKDYSINFMMTALHRGIAAENQLLTAVFNSFRMIDRNAPAK